MHHIWVTLLYNFTLSEKHLASNCLCRLQHVTHPFVRGAFYWLSPYAPGHFQSGGVLLSSHLKDDHWNSVCCFTRQWQPFKRNRAAFSLCVKVSTLLRSAAVPPLFLHPAPVRPILLNTHSTDLTQNIPWMLTQISRFCIINWIKSPYVANLNRQ